MGERCWEFNPQTLYLILASPSFFVLRLGYIQVRVQHVLIGMKVCEDGLH